jgi:tape measure domain-containing protein
MNNQELRITVTAKDSASSVIKKIQHQLNDSSSSLSKGLDQATHSAKGLGGGLDVSAKSAAVMGAVAGASAAGVMALARGLRSVADAAIGGASDYEQARIAFETMLGSADDARVLLTDISEFAKKTPFDLPGVVQGAKSLLAYGIEADNLLPTLDSLGNIAAGVGRDKLPQLILAFGQVRAAGQLTGAELRQFTEAGVPLLEELAKVTGKTTAQVKKEMEDGAAISFETVEGALRGMSQEGGRFFGLMEKQSKTLGGIWSNIKDGFNQTLRSAVGMTEAGDIIEGSLFDRLKDVAEIAMPAMQRAAENIGPAMNEFMKEADRVAESVGVVAKQVYEYLEPKLEALFNTIRDDLIPVLRKFWKDYLEPLMPVIGEILVFAIGLAIDAFNFLLDAITKVGNWMSENEPIILAVATAFGILKGAMIFDAVVNAIIVQFNLLKLVHIPSLMASFGALQTLIATPMIMPAIVVAAAVLALTLLYNEAQKTRAAVEGAIKAHEKAADISGIVNQSDAFGGQPTNGLSILGGGGLTQTNFRATGGRVSAGQAYTVGESQAETFVPNTSGRIMPSARGQEAGGKVTNVLSGTFNFNTAEAVDAMWTRLDRTQRLARMGMA